MTGEDAIYDALANYVGSLQLTPSFANAISYPNRSFKPPVATSGKTTRPLPYLSLTYMPNMVNRDGLAFDSDVTFQGLLQISVFWPADDGVLKPLKVARQIANAFAPGLWIENQGTRVKIDRESEVNGYIQETDFVHVPVTVRWRSS